MRNKARGYNSICQLTLPILSFLALSSHIQWQYRTNYIRYNLISLTTFQTLKAILSLAKFNYDKASWIATVGKAFVICSLLGPII